MILIIFTIILYYDLLFAFICSVGRMHRRRYKIDNTIQREILLRFTARLLSLYDEVSSGG